MSGINQIDSVINLSVFFGYRYWKLIGKYPVRVQCGSDPNQLALDDNDDDVS